MLKKVKALRDSVPEKTKLIIYISAAAAVFIFCALFPLAFRGEVIVDGLFDTGARADLFAAYMDKENDIRIKVDSKPERSDMKYCSGIFDELYDKCIVDSKKTKVLSEGQEFITVSDGSNNLRLCHMWVQDQGDWSNWLDIYVDADTGFTYYLYVSSVCIENAGSYFDALPQDLSSKTIADDICKQTGFDLEVFNWSGNPREAASAFTYSGGEALIWEISCVYYPSTTLEIKISVA